MRSIFVLLILVMIGLNGKGQSVTALPDSVLSQCCLEVTLLNGNVTTVDWVFVQYVTRDGTGTKLFVEYAPNFGGIQWETQIRIQDDFDDVLERSKFIIIPFTVGSTDYGINRNWIANIEENTTTGGTWIYGRFGTPTKRKFSAVEDYETMKNLLLACRPRAIVVAENGLYTEADTVRMGGFLIEPTTITTEGYNWQMKDTLSSAEFGLDYLTPETGDTTVYWGRRSGSIRQMMQMGNRYWDNIMKDTVGGLYSDLIHTWNAGDPFLKYLIFNPLAPNSGTAWMQIQRDNSFLLVSNETTNPFYTLGWTATSTVAQLGANESGSGDPGNGVVMGAYGFGTTEYLFMRTKAVDDGTASVGQYLKLLNTSTGEVDFATIDLSAYLPIADTADMLDPYIQGAGTLNYLPKFTAGRVLGNSNIFDDGNKVEFKNGKPIQLPEWTTVGRPTGATNRWGFNTTNNWLEGYVVASGAYISPARAATTGGAFTAGYIPFGGTGGLTENANLRFTANTTLELPYGSFSTPAIEFGNTQKLYADYFGIKSVGSFGFYHYNHSNQLIGAFAVGVNLLNIGQNISGLRFGDNYIGYTANNTTALLNTGSGVEFFPGINTSGVGYTGTFKIRPNGDVYITSLPWVHPSAPNQATGALFELASTTKGFLMPKHTAAQRAAISSPITGLEVYQTDGTEGSYVKYASGWKRHLVEGDAATTWLKTELEAGRDVDITGGASTDFRIRNTRIQFDGKLKAGSDSSFVHDPAQDTTFYKGSAKQLGNLYTQSGTNAGRNFPNVLLFKSDAAYSVSGTSYGNPGTGQFNWYILNDQRNFGEDGFGIKNENLQSAFGPTSYTTLFTIRNNGNLELGYSYQSRYTRVNSDTFMVSPTYNVSPETVINAAPFYVVGHSAYRKVVVQSKFYIGTDSTLKFDPSNDLLQLSAYGTPATTAAALSKTLSNYGVGFATDGTVTSREIKRDTTIYVVDADYDFSAALTTAQVAARHNRVIFLMTTTAAAGSDSELTLHTPDINLMQCEYLVRSTDEAGGFDNRIIFGTNNAVDSTNGLVTNYYPSAGSGVGIRAGLRSGVYKYYYY